MTEEALRTSHAWVRWLSGGDATVRLVNLCQHLDHPDVTREALVVLGHQWRAHALQALRADDGQASVNAYCEVAVDARLSLLSPGKL